MLQGVSSSSVSGSPPALPGRQQQFDNSGIRFWGAMKIGDPCPCDSTFRVLDRRAIVGVCGLLTFVADKTPLRGPATRKPPALPGDGYFTCRLLAIAVQSGLWVAN
jgi:hypothetical protein